MRPEVAKDGPTKSKKKTTKQQQEATARSVRPTFPWSVSARIRGKSQRRERERERARIVCPNRHFHDTREFYFTGCHGLESYNSECTQRKWHAYLEKEGGSSAMLMRNKCKRGRVFAISGRKHFISCFKDSQHGSLFCSPSSTALFLAGASWLEREKMKT